MNTLIGYNRYLTLFLWLVALHSLAVGIGLIALSDAFLVRLGYAGSAERFFRTQGGVFHIAMALGYAMAASNLKRYECLLLFAVMVKSIATLFLFSYALFVKNLAVIWFSGMADFVMAMVIWYLYRKAKFNPDGDA